MSLKSSMVLAFAPSLFPGIRAGDWLRLLRQNRFRVSPRYAVRAASVSLFSTTNSVLGWYEDRRYGSLLQSVALEPPVFILGHWRSGTTLLQNLFSLDPRLAAPTLYEVLFPHTFLTTEHLLSRTLSVALPRTRYTDGVRFGLDVPHEDEFATCASSFCSPHVSMVFPHSSERYDRYLTLRNVHEVERARWSTALIHFLKKLTLKHGKPLVLKSPPHTARIRFLLDLFPRAKFLHLHRNPYSVFQSTLRLTLDSSRRQRLQDPGCMAFEERIIRIYREMYDAFFEDRERIPAGHFYEMCFEDLERDPIGELRIAYESLGLPPFAETEPGVVRYLDSVKGYRKNSHEPLSAQLERRIAQEWRRCFEEWNYSERLSSASQGECAAQWAVP